MPKTTFLNLPDAKRERIIELALDEFSSHPYRLASLSRIVSRAGIAKGSMYQYFKNKLDLYQWLVTSELERRRGQWLQQRAPSLQRGVFAELEQLALSHVGFMLEHPRLARLAANARSATADKELRELHDTLREQQLEQLRALLVRGQREGELSASLDPRALACVVEAMLLEGTTRAVLDQLKSRPATASRSREPWESLVQASLSLLRVGLQTQLPPPTLADQARHSPSLSAVEWHSIDDAASAVDLPS